jgi:ribonucleoside-diphosphate reductase alpha chain
MSKRRQAIGKGLATVERHNHRSQEVSSRIKRNGITYSHASLMADLKVDPVHAAVGVINQKVCEDVWRAKYRQGEEKDLSATARRVAVGLFGDSIWADALARSMELGVFFPAGRTIAGAGTANHVTLHNCYVIGTIPDSMSGIFNSLRDAGLTLQMGGGVGQDFSPLRPEGAKLKRTGEGSRASGPLPFMGMWNEMSRTIMSIGHRRGAMMATISDHHPDIFKFITAKHVKGALQFFNVSVLVSDAFIAAIEEDADWELYHEQPPADGSLRSFLDDQGVTQYVYEVVKARHLWNTILESTYTYAEPGVIFIDRVNELNNLKDFEKINCTNPCGEQPLPPYGACDLGSVNLARMIKAPFTREASTDLQCLEAAVKVGMRTLDAVIDKSLYPLPEYEQEQIRKRRVGLGVLGLADALAMLGLTYGSAQAVNWTDMIMQTIANCAYRESALMAHEKGMAPVWRDYSRKKMLELPFISKLSIETRGLIKKYGLRNGVLLSIAPTGTMATAFGNPSSGCEPVFLHVAARDVIMPGSTIPVKYETLGYGYKVYQHVYGPTEVAALPTYMVTAKSLTVDDHIAMQAIVQKWVDASVSKTVNCPVDMTLEQFKRVYEQAYLKGCKGCTTYRPSDVRGSVLSEIGTSGTELNETSPSKGPGKRPAKLPGDTYQVIWPSYESSIYVTITEMENKVREMFVNSADAKNFEWITATMRMISMAIRLGADPHQIIEDLGKIKSFGDFKWEGGKLWPSLVARIMGVLEEHLNSKSDAEPNSNVMVATKQLVLNPAQFLKDQDLGSCPACSVRAFVHQSGCGNCLSCGFSNCG